MVSNILHLFSRRNGTMTSNFVKPQTITNQIYKSDINLHLGVYINGGTPTWMVWKIQIRNGWFWVPLFQETSIFTWLITKFPHVWCRMSSVHLDPLVIYQLPYSSKDYTWGIPIIHHYRSIPSRTLCAMIKLVGLYIHIARGWLSIHW